jgi:hypothetical protein
MMITLFNDAQINYYFIFHIRILISLNIIFIFCLILLIHHYLLYNNLISHHLINHLLTIILKYKYLWIISISLHIAKTLTKYWHTLLLLLHLLSH